MANFHGACLVDGLDIEATSSDITQREQILRRCFGLPQFIQRDRFVETEGAHASPPEHREMTTHAQARTDIASESTHIGTARTLD